MRIITWNVHGARKESAVWKLLLELQPDLILLQEVGGIPEETENRRNTDYVLGKVP